MPVGLLLEDRWILLKGVTGALGEGCLGPNNTMVHGCGTPPRLEECFCWLPPGRLMPLDERGGQPTSWGDWLGPQGSTTVEER